MNKKFLSMAAAAMMFAACTEDALQPEPIEVAKTPAVMGQTPVGFNAYTNRAATRSGVAGPVTTDALKNPATSLIGQAGFGVFAYYTDNKEYASNTKPDFMYNQQVAYNASAQGFTYTPVKYWPNEYGSNAESVDEDMVSFFAYAPYVEADVATGKVANESYGITGFTRNTAAGDPLVKYTTSFNLGNQVDLVWGTVASDATTWATLNSAGSQNLAAGRPYLNVQHPANIDQKMKFNFQHALAQLNMQIDLDADLSEHADNDGHAADKTKVYVRSISFGGIVLKGALNLNNTSANAARWMNYTGDGDISKGAEVVVLNDGRKDGKEGAVANGSEPLNNVLNTTIISNTDNTTEGVTGDLKNLFRGTQSAVPADALAEPVYVIPNPGENLTVTIVYDVETEDANLAGYLSDGKTHGSSIENKITKEIAFGSSTGMQSGYKYTVKLHIGLNSVKFDAEVKDWDETTYEASDVWVPSNQGEGVYNPANPLTLVSQNTSDGTSVTTNALGQTGANATRYTIPATNLNNNNILIMKADGAASWTVDDPSVLLIRSDEGNTEGYAATRAAVSINPVDEISWQATVASATQIAINPLKKGTATITSELNGEVSTIVITVDASEVTLTMTDAKGKTVPATSLNLYKFDTPVTGTVTGAITPASSGTDSWASPAYKITKVLDSTGAEVDLTADGAADPYLTISATDGVFTITPVNVCTATVQAVTANGATAEFTVTVAEPTITLSVADISVKGGSTASQKQRSATLIVTAVPADIAIAVAETDADNAFTYELTSSKDGVYVYSIVGSDAASANATGSLKFTFDGHTDSDAVGEATVSVQAIDPGLPLANATTDVGRILALNGKTYATAAEATLWGQTPVAIIAYYNSEADQVDSSIINEAAVDYHYLALALTDANNSAAVKWDSRAQAELTGWDFPGEGQNGWNTYLSGIERYNKMLAHTEHDHPAASVVQSFGVDISALATADETPVPNSGWFLPTMKQWGLITFSLTDKTYDMQTGGTSAAPASGKTADSYVTGAELNKVLSAKAGTSANVRATSAYWSSTEYSSTYAWLFYFGYGRASGDYKWNSGYVRPVLAF